MLRQSRHRSLKSIASSKRKSTLWTRFASIVANDDVKDNSNSRDSKRSKDFFLSFDNFIMTFESHWFYRDSNLRFRLRTWLSIWALIETSTNTSEHSFCKFTIVAEIRSEEIMRCTKLLKSLKVVTAKTHSFCLCVENIFSTSKSMFTEWKSTFRWVNDQS